MAHLEFELSADVPPERLIAALTDMTDRRPDLWPGLNRAEYRVIETGASSATIREGSGGPVWAIERYEWSEPGVVRWTVLESGFSRPGDFVEARISGRPDGGSRVRITWQRRGATLAGRLAVIVIWLTRGWPVKRSMRLGFEAIAREGARGRGA
jgi:hypothetical protein